jgi:hypothetical protein
MYSVSKIYSLFYIFCKISDVFEYTIEHASKEMNRQEQDREMKMYREVYTRHKDFLQACVGTEFELVCSATLISMTLFNHLKMIICSLLQYHKEEI